MIISSGLPDGTERLFLPVNLLHGAIAAAILIVLYFISLHNYLLFHGLVEISGIAVVFSIFIIIWNTRRVVPDGFFLIIGISFLFIGEHRSRPHACIQGNGGIPDRHNRISLTQRSGSQHAISRASRS